MADQEAYQIIIHDPKAGKVKRGTFQPHDPLTDEERQQLPKLLAQKYHVAPEAIELVPVQRERMERTAGKVVRNLAEAAPYLALGLIAPESIPLGMGLRTIGAAGIGGVEAALEGKDIGWEAVGSSTVQAALEALTPPVAKLIRRGGGRALRRIEDQLASQLMTRIKEAVPWLKSLPEGHRGLEALTMRGEGPAILSERYGQALAAAKDAIPAEATVTLTAEEAKALKIPMVPDLPEGTIIQPEQYRQLFNPQEVTISIQRILDKVPGLWRREPALAHKLMSSIDSALPEVASTEFQEARRLFREGTSLTNFLKESQAFDQASARLNVERLMIGGRTPSGTVGGIGKTPYELYLNPRHAPEAHRIVSEVLPLGMKAPRAWAMKHSYASPLGHFGAVAGEAPSVSSVLSKLQPSTILYSANIPFTEAERLGVAVAPSVVHAGAKALGVAP